MKVNTFIGFSEGVQVKVNSSIGFSEGPSIKEIVSEGS